MRTSGALLVLLIGCSSQGNVFPKDGGGSPSDSGGQPDQSAPPPSDGGQIFGDSSASDASGDGGAGTTVYANTDDTLYSLDPQSNAISLIGAFAGLGGGTNDTVVTDVAVNSSGEVYVNTPSVVYKATLPTTPPGTVNLSKLASIALQTGQRFYALGFTPAGALAAGEVLIGGDNYGELFAIDTTNGSTIDLGSFGPDPSHATYNFALSGDVVFYVDANQAPTGLATVRPCKPKTTTCLTSDDYLVAVDMTALATAYKTATPAASLLKGIYGGTTTSDGPGTGYADLFGLGVWEGTVFAFARKTSTNATPLLLTINTTSGQGTVVSSSFSFTNGWSGAGVTTSVSVTVPPPK
ncbi:MAG TPA: hypothetical protein VLM85_11465 [Polyangiaceae bacterium]|nr:hypothetical protein [Polyangiaceae bacterium]